MSLAISIVSFNTNKLLENCLQNLYSQKSDKKINIWVLDNNSNDGSAQMVEKKFPQVKLIKSDQNLGFSKGQNKILKEIQDDYVLILNPDTKIEKNVLSEMLKFMEENPDCVISSCKLLDFNNKLQSNGGDFPLFGALINWLFNLEILGLSLNFHRFDTKYYKTSHKVDWVSGTFMLIKTDIFKRVGFLDERYFMYFEDVDFCYRVSKIENKIMLNPNVSINHKSGASSNSPNFYQWKSEFMGLIKFYNTYWGILGSILIRVFIYLAIYLRILAFFLKGERVKAGVYLNILSKL